MESITLQTASRQEEIKIKYDGGDGNIWNEEYGEEEGNVMDAG